MQGPAKDTGSPNRHISTRLHRLGECRCIGLATLSPGPETYLSIELNIGHAQPHESGKQALVQVAVFLESHILHDRGQLVVVANQTHTLQAAVPILLTLQRHSGRGGIQRLQWWWCTASCLTSRLQGYNWCRRGTLGMDHSCMKALFTTGAAEQRL